MTPGVVVLAALLAIAWPTSAQVAAPNAVGVSAAHVHLRTADLAATEAFWAAVHGTPTTIGTMVGVRFPGIYVLFQQARGRGRASGLAPRESVPTAIAAPETSVGSVVEAIGFKVKDLRATLRRLQEIGNEPDLGATTTRAVVMSPERVRVFLTEEPSLPSSAASHEIVMRVLNPGESAAWYERWFGARAMQNGPEWLAEMPGIALRFVPSPDATAGSRGRALDHIGFEVVNLRDFVTRLEAGDAVIESAYRNISLGFLTSLAFVTDPWGTYIELNEGYTGH